MKSLMLFAVSCLLVSAQTLIVQPAQFNHAYQTVPGAIPTSLTCLVGKAAGCLLRLTATASDPQVCGFDFTATGQTIIMQDQNTIPWVINGVALGTGGAAVGTMWQAPNDLGCRMFSGGVYIQAGGVGVTGRITIKFNGTPL